MKRATWFILFLLMGVSCLDQPDCFRQNVNVIGISFKKLYDRKADTVAFLKVSANSTYDSSFATGVLASSLALPLNYLQNQTEFLFQTLEPSYSQYTQKDLSLILSHESKAQFVSEECGQRFVVSNLKEVFDNFDSLRLVSASPSNTAGNNIIVYRCPRTNVMRFSFRQLYMDTTKRGRTDSREIELIETPSVPLYKKTTLNTVLLPLDKTAGTSSYHFKFANGDDRTVTFNYTVANKQILEACGTQPILHDLKNTAKTFEFIEVLNDSIQDPPITNVETYRCPTTNQIVVSFLETKGSSKVSKNIVIKSLKADYLTGNLLTDSTTSSVVLPLNPNINVSTTTFTFDIDGVIKTLEVNYTVVPQKFHERCGEQPVFSNLKTSTVDATFSPTILLDKVSFPAVKNIEIIL